ncbi:MAG: PAS domain S-box protein [Candidatus Cloacimonas sp.]|nr:PAS domain S-box protein [Candidatus Cloacimonadota bacterium]
MAEDNKVVQALMDLLSKKNASAEPPKELRSIQGFDELYKSIHHLRGSFISLSRGKLDEKIVGQGFLFGTLKDLQSSLKHLTWQTKRVSEGDFTQKVEFLGEFSDAFNEMALKLEIQVSILEQTRKQLAESEENFRQIAENMEEVFWLNDKEGNIIYLSPSFTEVWNIDRSEIKTVDDLLLMQAHESDIESVRVALEGFKKTKVFNKEFKIKLRDNSVKTVAVRLNPICNQDGNVIKQAGIAQDITEIVNYQNKLIQSLIQAENARDKLKNSHAKIIELEQRNALLAMSVTANHEMNQPLTILKGNLELLREKLDEQAYGRIFDRLETAIEKIESILNKLKNIDRVKLTNYVGDINMIDISEENTGNT